MIMQEYHAKQQKRQQQMVVSSQQLPMPQAALGPPHSPMMSVRILRLKILNVWNLQLMMRNYFSVIKCYWPYFIKNV